MKHLVIGGNGFIGQAVIYDLALRDEDVDCTLREHLDLSKPIHITQGPFDIIYLCAGAKGYATCDKDPRGTWTINVDAQITIAQHYTLSLDYRPVAHPSPLVPVFIVYISSDAVEFSTSWYAIQRRHVEAYMSTINAAIIRPGPISKERVPDFAKLVVDIGLSRKRGLTQWQ